LHSRTADWIWAFEGVPVPDGEGALAAGAVAAVELVEEELLEEELLLPQPARSATQPRAARRVGYRLRVIVPPG